MKYRFSVWNIIIALLLFYVVYIFVKPAANPTTVMGVAYLIPVLIAGAIIDLILQMVIKNRRLLALVETISLIIIVVINQMP